MPANKTRPDWKVYYSGNFWGHPKGQRRGKELPLNMPFCWEGENWRLLSAYLCGPGLVIEVAKKSEPEELKAFLEKWTPLAQDEETLSEEQREQIEAENPLSLKADLKVSLNGRPLKGDHGCACCWNPFLQDAPDDGDAAGAAAHYGLDPAAGWLIWRKAFRWATRRRPPIRRLGLTFSAAALPTTAAHLRFKKEGDAFSVARPLTGQAHTLRLVSLCTQTLPDRSFPHQNRFIYPTHFLQAEYTLVPGLPQGCFQLMDCCQGDRPMPLESAPLGPSAQGAAVIGIIDSAVGVAAFPNADAPQGQPVYTACSALHFEPVKTVEWRAVFYEKPKEDKRIFLTF